MPTEFHRRGRLSLDSHAYHSKFQKGMQDTFQNGLWQFAIYGLSSRNTKCFPGTNGIYAPHGFGQTHGFAQGSKLSLVYKDW